MDRVDRGDPPGLLLRRIDLLELNAPLADPDPAWASLIGIGFDRTLYSIDETDGSGAAIGTAVGPENLDSGAIDGSGTIYSVTTANDRLILIQPDGSSAPGPVLDRAIDARGIAISAAGAATDVDSGVAGTFAIQAIEFGPDGTLYGAQNEVFTISLADGGTTLVGSGSYSGVRGLTFVPEPGTALLLASGLLGLAAAGRRRARIRGLGSPR